MGGEGIKKKKGQCTLRHREGGLNFFPPWEVFWGGQKSRRSRGENSDARWQENETKKSSVLNLGSKAGGGGVGGGGGVRKGKSSQSWGRPKKKGT